MHYTHWHGGKCMLFCRYRSEKWPNPPSARYPPCVTSIPSTTCLVMHKMIIYRMPKYINKLPVLHIYIILCHAVHIKSTTHLYLCTIDESKFSFFSLPGNTQFCVNKVSRDQLVVRPQVTAFIVKEMSQFYESPKVPLESIVSIC